MSLHKFPNYVLPFALLLATASAVQAQSTFLYLDSQPGDYIGGGRQQTFTTLDGNFFANGNFDNGVSVSFSGTSHSWSLDFAPATGHPFGPGGYTSAERYPFQSPSVPGLSVSGDGRGCNTLTGRFVILEMTVNGGGTITNFAADFEQHCEGGTPALFGSIRINSSLTVVPRLVVGGGSALEGDIGFNDSAFHVFLSRPATVTVSATYRTMPGSALPLADYLPAHGSFDLPPGSVDWTVPVLIRTNTTVQPNRNFTLELSNPSGAIVAFGSANADIIDDDDGKTVFYLDSQAFDYIGQGARQTLTTLDGSFTGTLSNGHAEVNFAGSDYWTLEFAAPNGLPLTPGAYNGATRWPFQSASEPGLSVYGAGRGCNTLTGRFVILEAVMGTGNNLARFAADFEQHCEGGSSALFGSIRLNSTVPLTQQTPVAGDLDADGWTDLTWRHQNLGFDVVQLLHGVAGAGFGNLPRLSDPNWEIVGTNDWNGDGKTDLFWRNRVTGQDFVVFLSGVTPTGVAVLPTVAPEWKFAGSGRFDNDGWPDVLWRNESTGENGIAFMSGTSVTNFQFIDSEPDLDWTVGAAADFNRDGHADILWHNRTTLANRVWYVGGFFPSVLGTANVLPNLPDWDLACAGDFDHDGQADLVWRNAVNGQSVVWFMREKERTGLAFLDPLTDLDWKIVGPK